MVFWRLPGVGGWVTKFLDGNWAICLPQRSKPNSFRAFWFLLARANDFGFKAGGGIMTINANRILFVTGLILAACAWLPAATLPAVQEQQLGNWPTNGGGVIAASQDGSHVAWTVKDGSTNTLVVDGKPQPIYQRYEYVTFSPDGKRVASYGLKGDKWFMVVDGKEEWSFNVSGVVPGNPLMPVVFSADGTRWAFMEPKGNVSAMVVDGKEGPDYGLIDDVQVNEPIFSPDGKHFAYIAHKGQKHVLVMDGVEGKEYESSGQFVFSSDSQHWWYFPRNRWAWYMVADGKESPAYDDISGIVFSANKEVGAFAATNFVAGKNMKKILTTNGIEGPSFDDLDRPILSNDGQRLAYRAFSNDRWIIVLDGKEHPEFGDSPRVIFSPDGKRMAYIKPQDGKFWAVVDGNVDTAFDNVRDVIFSPDGSGVAYVLNKNKGKYSVVFNGKEGMDYDQGGGNQPPIFSPDGKHLAFVGQKDGKYVMVVDGQGQAEYNLIYGRGPIFSADGKHTAYSAALGKKRVVVLDGNQGPEYNTIMGEPAFGPDGALYYSAVRDNALYRVKQPQVEQ